MGSGYAYSVAFFCPLVKMFFAQKMHDKFSRISLSLPGQKYAILNSAYLPRAGELLSEYERRDLFMNKTRVRLAALLLAVS